jgi:hypothetical protein
MMRIALLLALMATAQGVLVAQIGELPYPVYDPSMGRLDESAYKGSAILLHMGLGVQTPAGDMSKRFGNNGVIGGGIEYISASNWIIGAEGHMIFGNKVKEDPLGILRTPEGDIIGNDRTIAQVELRERGMYAGGTFGRLFPLVEGKRAGIRISLSGGWVQHKIRIQDDSRSVTQLSGDYTKGYDRLTGGLALNPFIGWQQFGRSDGFNFMLGIELNQGFTNTLRSWDFTERRKLDEQRSDMRLGVRAQWTLPFFLRTSDKIYY